MNVTLLNLLQGVGATALAIVAFTVALTWPALVPSIRAVRPDRTRHLLFSGLGVALLLTTVPLYLAPGVLLHDGFDAALATMLIATWAISVGALVIRGLLLSSVARAFTLAFAAVAGTGLIAGFGSSLATQNHVADTITPTGAFLLVIAAVAAVIFWSNADDQRKAEPAGASA
ncbi:hypothetical protein [Leifsonia sp. NPDC058230]|uniref:hypothetical protein n=1 Tax=Leifsonia sp. NPDC058230 TaxID=3346391 RepID=UPI0036DAF49E